MNRYKIKEVKDERWAIWYMDFPKRRGGKIGCYKIIDLFKPTREKKFAFRYLPREGQTQEQSDNLIILNTINNFYKKRNFIVNKED